VDNGHELEILTTSGWKPGHALCEAKDDWTIYNISLDHQTGIVFFDPEKIHRLEQQRIADERRKKIHDVKVEFIRQVSWYHSALVTPRFSILSLVIVGLLGFLLGLSLSK
jgi:hypothetical protein